MTVSSPPPPPPPHCDLTLQVCKDCMRGLKICTWGLHKFKVQRRKPVQFPSVKGCLLALQKLIGSGEGMGPVLRIHDILVWIRIRGSMPLTNKFVDSDADPDTSFFHHWPSRCHQKTNKKKFFCTLFLKVLLHHFSKVKSQKEVTKQYKSRFFLLFLLNDRRIRIWIHTSN